MASSQNLVDRVVAVVEQDIILQSELDAAKSNFDNEWLRMGLPAQAEAANPERRVLDQLINQKLVELEMKRRGMYPKDSDIDAMVSSIMEEHGFKTKTQFSQALLQEGLSEQKHRENLKHQMMQGRVMSWIVKPQIKEVSDTEVDKVLSRRKGLAARKEVNLSMIMKQKSPANKKSLEKWQNSPMTLSSFAQLAQNESEGPAKDQGGNIGFVGLSDLQPILNQALTTLSAQTVSAVLETPDGYYLLFFHEERSGAITASDTERMEIKQELERQHLARAFDQFISKQRTDHRVNIRL